MGIGLATDQNWLGRIRGGGGGGVAFVFQAGYHPRKIMLKHTLNTYFFRYENRP